MERKVAPESPTSIGAVAPVIDCEPVTAQHPLVTSNFVPKASIARTVASVSAEYKGPEILDSPGDSEAAMSILWVYDFEGGAHTSPFSCSVFPIITFAMY